MAVVSRGEERSSGDAQAAEGGTGLARWEPVAAGLAALAVYASTRSRIPALTHDAVSYQLAIETGGAHLYHPHHLGYGPAAAAWLGALDAVGLAGEGLDRRMSAVALLNSVAGGGVVALVHALLRNRAHLPRWVAAAGALGAALSFGVWFYSGNVEVYLIPLVFLLGALYVLAAPELTGRHVVLVGVLHGLAMLGHQVHLLFAAVVVAALAGRGLATRRHLVRYVGAAAAVVAAAYGLVLAVVVRPGSPGAAVDWFTAYAQGDAYWYRPGPMTVPTAAFGFGRSVVGGHFLFRLDAVADRVVDAFPGKSLSDEVFLVRGLGVPLAVALGAGAAVAGGLLAAVLVRGLRNRRLLPVAAARLVVPLVVWLAAYGAFFLVWEPWNAEFWIPQATALWMLLAILSVAPDRAQQGPRHLAPRPGRAGAPLLAAAVLVGLVNLAGTILPATDEGNDVYARQYRGLAEIVGPGDAVVVDRPHLGVGYARRFTAASPIPASPFATFVDPDRPERDFSAEQVVIRVDRTLEAGRVVAVAPELLTQPSTAEAEATAAALRRSYGGWWRRVETGRGVTWLVLDGRSGPQAGAAHSTRGG